MTKIAEISIFSGNRLTSNLAIHIHTDQCSQFADGFVPSCNGLPWNCNSAYVPHQIVPDSHFDNFVLAVHNSVLD
jgi:hypothetical protein